MMIDALAGEALPTEAIAYRTLPTEVLLDGVVEAVNQATLSARTSGEVTAVNFDVNQFVQEGQVLLRIKAVRTQSGVIQAKAGEQEAEAYLRQAENEYNRVKRLFEKQMATGSAMDQAQAALTSAHARVGAAKAQGTSAQDVAGDTIVRAPYSGYVIKRYVEVGETAQVGQPLFTGISLEKLRVRVDIPQNRENVVRQAKTIRILRGEGISPLAGGAVTIFPYADESSHSFRARVDLPEKDVGIKPGMLVKVAFVIGTNDRLLAPVKALVQRGEITGVYVLGDNGQLRFRSVLTGRLQDDGKIELLTGLSAGEKVVLDPVKAGQQYRSGGEKL
ncbi:Efflux transporter periplasmic adaptor subunit [Gammaproteobacteria bacterium]